MEFEKIQFVEYSLEVIKKKFERNNVDFNYKLIFESNDDIFTASSLIQSKGGLKFPYLNEKHNFSYNEDTEKNLAFEEVRTKISDSFHPNHLNNLVFGNHPHLIIQQIINLIKDIEVHELRNKVFINYESIKNDYSLPYKFVMDDSVEIVSLEFKQFYTIYENEYYN